MFGLTRDQRCATSAKVTGLGWLVVVEEASRGRERAWKSRAAPPQSHSRSPRNINTKTSPHAVRHIDIEHEEIALEATMALSYLRQLYSLDTLDTRFVVPATVPPKEALEEANVDPAISDGKDKSRSGANSVQPPRWKTNEFYFYYLAISASIFFMFKLVLECSKGQSRSLSPMLSC
jgi:hypothetical protein